MAVDPGEYPKGGGRVASKPLPPPIPVALEAGQGLAGDGYRPPAARGLWVRDGGAGPVKRPGSPHVEEPLLQVYVLPLEAQGLPLPEAAGEAEPEDEGRAGVRLGIQGGQKGLYLPGLQGPSGLLPLLLQPAPNLDRGHGVPGHQLEGQGLLKDGVKLLPHLLHGPQGKPAVQEPVNDGPDVPGVHRLEPGPPQGVLGLRPVALLDDDPAKWGGEVEGVPVLGGWTRRRNLLSGACATPF